MLGTPPAFVLSQDQTLEKKFRKLISSILNTNVIFTFFVKFFGIDKVLKPCAIVVIVLFVLITAFSLCTFQTSRLAVARAFQLYHVVIHLSRTFFKFFNFFILNSRFLRQLVYYSRTLTVCQHFFSKNLTFFHRVCKQPFS